MIRKEQLFLKMSDGKDLYAYLWSDNEIPARKAIVLCHGMAEHIDRYQDFAVYLVQNGFTVLGYNQRGHRFTDGKDDYGYMGKGDNFEVLVSDLHEAAALLKSKNPELPLWLFGHSMGSFVVTRFSEKYGSEIDGAVIGSTGRNPAALIRAGVMISSLIRFFRGDQHRSKLLNKMTFGSFNKEFAPNRTNFDWLNRDEEEVDKYIADEWCGGIFTAKYFHDFFKGCLRITRDLKKIPENLPLLLISGDKDPVGNNGKGVTLLYHELCKTNRKTVLKLFKEARHELLLEENKEEVFREITDFISENQRKAPF